MIDFSHTVCISMRLFINDKMSIHDQTIVGCNAIDVRGKCQINGGPHWMTLEAARYTATSHGRKWHPSAGMHLLRGEIIAYRYSYILLDAIYTVRGEPGFQDSDLLKTRLRDELQKLQPDIGSMTPVYCDDVCKFRPNCFTGKNFIDEMTRFST